METLRKDLHFASRMPLKSIRSAMSRTVSILTRGVIRAPFDLESLELAINRKLSTGEREEFVETRRQANRCTYLGSGMTHPNFVATLERLTPTGRRRVQQVASALS
jgi:hypothetical protein